MNAVGWLLIHQMPQLLPVLVLLVLLYRLYTMTNALHLVGENLPAGRLEPARVVDRESCTFIMQVNFIVRKASKFFHGV